MFKIQVTGTKCYNVVSKIPVISSFFVFDVLHLHKITRTDTFIRVIDHIRLGNGTYKTTNKNRFTELDLALVGMLRTGFEYTIHDLAVSDGSTSCELYSRLAQNKISVRFLISDKFSFIKVFRYFPFKLYYDSVGTILYGSFFNILADRKLSLRFLVSKFLGSLIGIFPKSSTGHRVVMLNPTTNEFMDKGYLSFKEIDIFNEHEMNGKFDIIRCMNVLNTHYFGSTDITNALKNIRNSLNEDGLLIIGRTEINSQRNLASIFRVSGSEVSEVASFNGGYEASDLVVKVFSEAGR